MTKRSDPVLDRSRISFMTKKVGSGLGPDPDQPYEKKVGSGLRPDLDQPYVKKAGSGLGPDPDEPSGIPSRTGSRSAL